jgi:thioredoxin reductase (NADPH)
MEENVIIIGAGCAGLTAAVYTGRGGLKPLVIEGPMPGGNLTMTTTVENFPGFPEGIQGFELTTRCRQQAERFGARFIRGKCDRVDLAAPSKRLWVGGDKEMAAKAVIIATGASSRLLGVPGEKELMMGRGVSTCATCDGAFYKDEQVAVIGGGDTACEEALFLTRFCSKVFLVHRRDRLRASAIMAERILNHPKIEVVWNAAVESFLPNPEGSLRGLKIRSDAGEKELPCSGAFLAIGYIPCTDFLKGQLPLDADGYIQTLSEMSVCTTIPGVFAAGECTDRCYRQAVVSAAMGCQAALEAARDRGF